MNKRLMIRGTASTAISALVAVIFSMSPFHEPRGPIYERLKAARKSSAPSRELLIIETDSAAISMVGPQPWPIEEWTEALYLLAEMECARLVSDVPVPVSNSSLFRPDFALADSIERELSRISYNIRTLFDAIRLGSVRPKDAEAYVAELVEMTDSAKKRLRESAAGTEKENRVKPLEDAEAALGAFYGDRARFSDIERNIAAASFSYAGVSPESGPPVFAALLDRLGKPSMLMSADKLVLGGARMPEGARLDVVIPLHKGTAILFDSTESIRRISFEPLFRHRRLESELLLRLKAMENEGYPMTSGSVVAPLPLYNAIAELRTEIAEDRDKKDQWRSGRNRFFASVETLLSGEAEKQTLAAFDALLNSPDIDVEGRILVSRQKENAQAAFAAARVTNAELSTLRSLLRKELTGTFCFAGPSASTGASFVQAVFSNRFIRTPRQRDRFIAIFLPAFVCGLILLRVQRRSISVTIAFTTIAAEAAVAVGIFITYGLWLSPVSTPTATLAMATTSMIIAAVTNPQIRKQRPGTELIATVLVVRAKGLSDFAPTTSPRCLVAAFHCFRTFVAEKLESRGAVIRAVEGETISATFENSSGMPGRALLACEAAVAIVSAREELRRTLEAEGISFTFPPLRVGLEDGPCVVGAGDGTGGLLLGTAATRARILASLAERYEASILASEDISRKIGDRFEVKQLDRLKGKTSGLDEVFYQINGTKDEE